MITIGVRCSPKMVTYAVYDTEDASVPDVGVIKIPLALAVPEQLKYVRSNILDILREYNVERAGVRITEPNAQKVSVERVQIEAIVQESFASSDVKGYYIGQISSISARLDIDRKDFKKFVDGELDYDVDGWGNLSKDAREALLCAIGAEK